jgi:hypothetical protein
MSFVTTQPEMLRGRPKTCSRISESNHEARSWGESRVTCDEDLHRYRLLPAPVDRGA